MIRQRPIFKASAMLSLVMIHQRPIFAFGVVVHACVYLLTCPILWFVKESDDNASQILGRRP
jgi:hypothetical protein